MLGNFPPFTTMQELNLDWILTKIKNILRFVPDDGAVGQILRRTPSGAEWSDEQGAGGSVTSVNGMQGAVVLTSADVGALPDSTTIPTNTSDLNNDSGFITAAQAPVQSVNGQTGTVTISVPTNTSDLNNDSGFITAAQAPVQSVNGQTGAVTISVPTNTSDLNNDSGFITAAQAPVQSVNGQTGAVIISQSYKSGDVIQCGNVYWGYVNGANQINIFIVLPKPIESGVSIASHNLSVGFCICQTSILSVSVSEIVMHSSTELVARLYSATTLTPYFPSHAQLNGTITLQ